MPTRARTILLFAILLLSCGTESYPPLEICSNYTPEERAATEAVYDAFVSLGREPHGCLYFIHDVNKPIQALGGVAWIDYRWGDIEPTVPEIGYGGIFLVGVGTFVCRAGPKEPYLLSLLIHELAHNVGFSHGPDMRAFESDVWDKLSQKGE